MFLFTLHVSMSQMASEQQKSSPIESTKESVSSTRNSLEIIMETASNLMERHNLSEVAIKIGEISLSCKSNNQVNIVTEQIVEQKKPQKYNQNNHPNLTEVRSDSVGTIYLSSSPAENPYVMVGSRIVVGQTLFIIEAMKVMNHFKSPCNGVVKEILVRNEQVVEYGQVLIKVE